MDVGIIVGEASDVTWDRWRHTSRLIEGLGFHSLFRSDHYVNGRHTDAIDPYLAFVLTAEVTERIRFGPLVTPVTFRTPLDIGRMAQQLDALGDGRFVLGLGAGWHAEEHEVYGIDFPPRSERYDRLAEALTLLGELWYSEAATVDGTYYRLAGADSRPHPPPGRPPIIIGGSGPRRTLRLVAEHGAEWNATPMDPNDYATAVDALERHCDDVGRDPADIRRSMLLFATIGPDRLHADRALDRYLTMVSPIGATLDLDRAMAAGHVPWRGSVEELVDLCGQLRRLGLDEIVFDHLVLDDDTIPRWLAEEVKPALEAL